MTDDMMNLRSLLEKTPDADVLREMIGFAAERVVELQVAGLPDARCGERSPTRSHTVTAIASEPGRRGRVRSHRASRS